MARVLNVNVGILGHVDSGKTSLAKALSTINSTAAFDKNPQSQERGITLDLGFSAFMHDVPPHLAALGYEQLQITLVDCPGHASLIRTIIGGAHIINMMILVIDVTKGIQTQTAECIVIGELMTGDLLVVLNKIDQLEPATRDTKIEKMKAKLSKTFESTRFRHVTMVSAAARPSGDESGPVGIHDIMETICSMIGVPEPPDLSEPFYFAIDHCFPIKGQGTVITGTVLAGSVEVNQTIEFPDLKLQRKIKSMQMFKKPVTKCIKGDRVGICVTQLDAEAIERGIAAAPGSIPTFTAAIVRLEKIRYHKQTVAARSRFHVTVGHTTVMGTASFFQDVTVMQPLDFIRDDQEFAWDKDYTHLEELHPTTDEHPRGSQFALLEFEHPITCPLHSILIGSRLDADIHGTSCRLSCYGVIVCGVDPALDRPRIRVFKQKQKTARVDRVADEMNVVGKDLVTKDKDITAFVGLRVTTEQGVEGIIQDTFGKSGKFKVCFRQPHGLSAGDPLLLAFKKYVFDPSKKLSQ